MTIEQTNVIVMPGAARRQQMHAVPDLCELCGGTGRMRKGLVGRDEPSADDVVRWLPRSLGIACSHPPASTRPDGNDAA